MLAAGTPRRLKIGTRIVLPPNPTQSRSIPKIQEWERQREQGARAFVPFSDDGSPFATCVHTLQPTVGLARNGSRQSDDSSGNGRAQEHSIPGWPGARLQGPIKPKIDGRPAPKPNLRFPLPGTGTWFAPRLHGGPLGPQDRNRSLSSVCHRLVLAACLALLSLAAASVGPTTTGYGSSCFDGEPRPIDGGSRPCKRPLSLWRCTGCSHWPTLYTIPPSISTPLARALPSHATQTITSPAIDAVLQLIRQSRHTRRRSAARLILVLPHCAAVHAYHPPTSKH